MDGQAGRPVRALHGFFRSSTSYRLRIALAFKGLEWDGHYVNLAALAHRQPSFLALNPQALVPVLVERGHVLTQTPAIMEYLEEAYPDPPMLPRDPFDRAYVRALSHIVACDIHPLNNARVLKYLSAGHGLDAAGVQRWYEHWVATGFAAFEAMLEREGRSGAYCLGDTPGMADICLVPQLANARRFACDLSAFPRLTAIADRAAALDAFRSVAPAGQPDAF